MRQVRVRAAALIGILMFAAGCSRAPEVHYRVTLEVETPEGPKTGSSVWAWRISKGGPATPYNGRFRGQAIIVDLGKRGALVGLISGQSEDGQPLPGEVALLPERAFGDLGRGMQGKGALHADRAADVHDISKRIGASANLECGSTTANSACPFLVRFGDLKEPLSVQAVNPNNLGNAFGTGVQLKRVVIQITDEPVTTGIDRMLPWLANQRGALLKVRGRVPMQQRPFAARITDGDFKMGID